MHTNNSYIYKTKEMVRISFLAMDLDFHFKPTLIITKAYRRSHAETYVYKFIQITFPFLGNKKTPQH